LRFTLVDQRMERETRGSVRQSTPSDAIPVSDTEKGQNLKDMTLAVLDKEIKKTFLTGWRLALTEIW